MIDKQIDNLEINIFKSEDKYKSNISKLGANSLNLIEVPAARVLYEGNGFRVFEDGFTIQWGEKRIKDINSSDVGDTHCNIDFPIAFKECYRVITGEEFDVNRNYCGVAFVQKGSITKTGFTTYYYEFNSSVQDMTVTYLAIGRV